MPQSSRSQLPTISFRCATSLLRLAKPGLARIVGSFCQLRLENCPDLLVSAPGGSPQPGVCFDRTLAKKSRDLWRIFLPRLQASDRVRMQLDFIDVSILLLAARVIRRLIREEETEVPRADFWKARAQLLRNLENTRKRAKSAALRSIGREGYLEIRRRWLAFARWLQTNPLYFQKPRDGWTLQYRRRILQRACEVARRELQKQGYKVPPDRDLRKSVRKALRRVRRDRAGGISIRAILERPEGAFFLRECVVNDCPVTWLQGQGACES